jgi:tetratricopeptide (TPR) repeat protein
MNRAFQQGVRMYHAHRFEQALAELRAAEKELPPTPEIDYYIGLALTHLGSFEEALLSLEKVVTSDFSFLHVMQARMVLGYVYAVTSRHRLAEFEFRTVVDLGVRSSPALAALGYVLYCQGKIPESVETLKEALAVDPRNANALNSLGFIYAEENIDLAAAASLCRRAVESSPKNAAYVDSLGWALFKQGRHGDARACFRKALELAPGNREIAQHLRLVLEALKAAPA